VDASGYGTPASCADNTPCAAANENNPMDNSNAMQAFGTFIDPTSFPKV
jgi:hypothetical protein